MLVTSDRAVWLLFFLMLFDTLNFNIMGFNLKIYHVYLLVLTYTSILIALKSKKLIINVDIILIIFLMYLAINTFIISEYFAYSLNRLIIVSFLFVAYTYVSSIDIKEQQLIKILASIGMITVVISISQLVLKYALHLNIDLYMEGRPEAFFTEPDWLGYFFLFTIPYSLYYIEHQNKYFLFAGNLLGLLLSQARAAWIAAAIVLIVYFLVAKKDIRRKYRFIIILLFALIVTLMAINAFFPGVQVFNQFFNRLTNILNLNHETTRYRLLILEETINLFKFNVFFGNGLDSFGSIFVSYTGMVYGVRTGLWNMYINIFIEVGIIGLVCFLIFVSRNIIQKVKFYTITKNQLLKYNLLSIVMMLIANNFSNGLYFLFLWINFAIGNSVIKKFKIEEKGNRNKYRPSS